MPEPSSPRSLHVQICKSECPSVLEERESPEALDLIFAELYFSRFRSERSILKVTLNLRCWSGKTGVLRNVESELSLNCFSSKVWFQASLLIQVCMKCCRIVGFHFYANDIRQVHPDSTE